VEKKGKNPEFAVGYVEIPPELPAWLIPAVIVTATIGVSTIILMIIRRRR